eukprot:255952-Amorphochlora_amoeboformis.AAC.2
MPLRHAGSRMSHRVTHVPRYAISPGFRALAEPGDAATRQLWSPFPLATPSNTSRRPSVARPHEVIPRDRWSRSDWIEYVVFRPDKVVVFVWAWMQGIVGCASRSVAFLEEWVGLGTFG